MFRTLFIHEPPLFGVVEEPSAETVLKESLELTDAVAEKLEAGQVEVGSRQFMEMVAMGPGAWEQLPEEVRQKTILNAPTFLDEMRDPEWNKSPPYMDFSTLLTNEPTAPQATFHL